MSRRTGVKWRVSVKENPRGGWPNTGNMMISTQVTKDNYSKAVSKIKTMVLRYFGTCTYEWRIQNDRVIVMFKAPSMRAWMDGMIAMRKADRRRKHKWVPDWACHVGETISQRLNTPYAAFVEVWANIDGTLPVEGAMTKQELEIIYGT